jgi:hypothetical protein
MTDYTKMSVGTLDGKEIAVCPHCGRRGLIEVTDGKTWYVHSAGALATSASPNDPVMTGWEMCPKIGPAK